MPWKMKYLFIHKYTAKMNDGAKDSECHFIKQGNSLPWCVFMEGADGMDLFEMLVKYYH